MKSWSNFVPPVVLHVAMALCVMAIIGGYRYDGWSSWTACLLFAVLLFAYGSIVWIVGTIRSK